jgi:hypothetical protein
MSLCEVRFAVTRLLPSDLVFKYGAIIIRREHSSTVHTRWILARLGGNLWCILPSRGPGDPMPSTLVNSLDWKTMRPTKSYQRERGGIHMKC